MHFPIVQEINHCQKNSIWNYFSPSPNQKFIDSCRILMDTSQLLCFKYFPDYFEKQKMPFLTTFYSTGVKTNQIFTDVKNCHLCNDKKKQPIVLLLKGSSLYQQQLSLYILYKIIVTKSATKSAKAFVVSCIFCLKKLQKIFSLWKMASNTFLVFIT